MENNNSDIIKKYKYILSKRNNLNYAFSDKYYKSITNENITKSINNFKLKKDQPNYNDVLNSRLKENNNLQYNTKTDSDTVMPFTWNYCATEKQSAPVDVQLGSFPSKKSVNIKTIAHSFLGCTCINNKCLCKTNLKKNNNLLQPINELNKLDYSLENINVKDKLPRPLKCSNAKYYNNLLDSINKLFD
jgi:hypothetical protein